MGAGVRGGGRCYGSHLGAGPGARCASRSILQPVVSGDACVASVTAAAVDRERRGSGGTGGRALMTVLQHDKGGRVASRHEQGWWGGSHARGGWQEECGVFAAIGVPDAATVVGLGLHALQHRGQEAAGIVSCDAQGLFHTRRGLGLGSEVFDDAELARLPGRIAIGHNRSSTSGSVTIENTQPLHVVYRGGDLALAHNGNLVNARELRQGLEGSGSIFQTTLDTEIFLHLMALSSDESPEDGLAEACRQVRGAYALIVLTRGRVLGVRDAHGLRPLCLGRLGDGYVLASETCALDLVGADYVRDVEPGEMVTLDPQGMRTRRVLEAAQPPQHCIFEHIYFSRPDSRVFGESVDRVRRRIGHR